MKWTVKQAAVVTCCYVLPALSWAAAVVTCCYVLPALSWAAADPPSTNLGDLSIEELMNESITSVTKKEQRFADAAAAIYVLTGEEILRAGFSSIPEALRMVRGLSVAQLDNDGRRGCLALWRFAREAYGAARAASGAESLAERRR